MAVKTDLEAVRRALAPPEARDRAFVVRTTRSELERLDALARAAGCTRSALVRELIRQATAGEGA